MAVTNQSTPIKYSDHEIESKSIFTTKTFFFFFFWSALSYFKSPSSDLDLQPMTVHGCAPVIQQCPLNLSRRSLVASIYLWEDLICNTGGVKMKLLAIWFCGDRRMAKGESEDGLAH